MNANTEYLEYLCRELIDVETVSLELSSRPARPERLVVEEDLIRLLCRGEYENKVELDALYARIESAHRQFAQARASWNRGDYDFSKWIIAKPKEEIWTRS